MAKSQNNSLRIIGGKWRGRKISFNEAEGLRPTHDRVRETLFNWLQWDIVDANCLDMFAGSGALGFEALSRNANHVVFLDNSKEVVLSINKNLSQLGADNAAAICFDFTKAIKPIEFEPFDIIFLDPPFHQGLWSQALSWLEMNSLMKHNALIYLEVERGAFDIDLLSENLTVIKHKTTQSLSYILLKYCPE